jgi:agmatinase
MRQQSAAEYLRHGQMPFFRLPLAKPNPEGAFQYDGADVVLLGVPYDGGATYQPGARLAPYHLRRVSALIQGFHPFHRVDVFEQLRCWDGGNVVFPPFNPGAVRELVELEIGRVLAAGAAPFVVGGDHSVTLPILRALRRKHGPLAIVHVDAHLDTSGPEVWGEVYHHGTPIRHALTEGLIERGQLHQVGIRGSWGGAVDAQVGQDHGARVYSTCELDRSGLGAAVRQICAEIGDRPLYITLDVDGIDPAFAPGTGTPVPGGLTSREALRLLRSLAGCNLVGMDVVEVCPALDHADITVHLAAQLLYEGLALYALR